MASSLPDHLKKWFQALMTEPATLELVKGVVEGDEALVRSALARGARPDVTFPTIAGSSGCLVCVAASRGNDHLLPHLLQAGLNIEGGGTDDKTPLMEAAGKGNPQTVKVLLSLGANPRATDRQGRTALHYAAGYGHQECVAALLSVYPATATHLEGDTPVHFASYHGQVQVLEQLAGAGWPLTARDSGGSTPLHYAAEGGHISAVRWLVLRGGDLRVQDKYGHTPLTMAVHCGHHQVETWLAKNGGGGVTEGSEAPHVSVKAVGGASPDQLYEELLSTVSRGDHVQEVSHLLCKGVPLESWGGHSVLKLAVTNDRARTVNLLLASGASLSASLLQKAWQSPNVTPQVLASLTTAYCCRLRAEKRRLVKISSVLVKGIKSLLKDIEGNTPWRTAWRWGKGTDRAALSDLLAKTAAANCPVTASFLHSAGAWTSFSQVSHGSALHAALDAGHQCMAELLIRDLGACPYVPDSVGRLPLDIITHEERRYHLEQFPTSVGEWQLIAQEFECRWHFPNCLGAVDGKHVRITPPPDCGSYFWNYKGYNSLVLLAAVNANYEFTMADIGTNGRVSDGGVIENTQFGKRLSNGTLNLPADAPSANSDTNLPYVFVGDEAFALRTNFLKPYPQKDLDAEKRVFNYRLSRARRVVENVFGIMASRFRVFHTAINLKLSSIEKVVMACVVLHNYLRKTCPSKYSPEDCYHREDIIEKIIRPGLSLDPNSVAGLENGQGTRNYSQMAKEVRVKFKEYFANEGAVPWQNDFV